MDARIKDNIETLGKKIADDAIRLIAKLYPAARKATTAQLEAASAAMRRVSIAAMDEMMDDVKAAPHLYHVSYMSAVLTIATTGINAMKSTKD